jgi:hypothetical protein
VPDHAILEFLPALVVICSPAPHAKRPTAVPHREILIMRRVLVLVASVFLCGSSLRAAELVTLTPATWDAFAGGGKEADRIYGDFVLRNEKIMLVVAKPVAGRNANMTVRNVGGAIIDMTLVNRPNDQLSAFYPGGKSIDWRKVHIDAPKGADPAVEDAARANIKAETVHLTVQTESVPGSPQIETRYSLTDGAAFVVVETTWHNTTNKPLVVKPLDELRADQSFERVEDGETLLYWVYDKWWDQAYGIVADGTTIDAGTGLDKRTLAPKYLVDDEKEVEVDPGSQFRLIRRFFPGRHHAQLRDIAQHLAHNSVTETTLEVKDEQGQPVAAADVELLLDGHEYATARTGADGKLVVHLPEDEGPFTANVESQPHGEKSVELKGETVSVVLPAPGYVVAKITAEGGGKIPCKVEFKAQDGEKDPFFNHQSGEHAVHNLYYSHDGLFRRALAPGKYQCIVSHGSEYDAVFTTIEVRRGAETPLAATLIRSVQTPGWVSADYHSHSSPSGDNTASQLGRVLNLLCEHIEFAPCTEHNRLSSYEPHLERLGVRGLMATCTGIELTDLPGDINHHNAFPMVLRPRTQDNGAPQSDADVEVKVARLAMWDSNSEKVIQQNHPDIGHLFYDRDGDGKPDQGFSKVIPHLDCIEIHPPHTIFQGPLLGPVGRETNNNDMFNWLQLINQGYRITGVVHTDAHYNFHGSGFLRIYVKSPQDDPAQVKTADMVHATQRGQVIMTNGPYLEVALEAAQGGERSKGTCGDEIVASNGKCTLNVRVQCANWYDIDRVQVLVSGRFVEELNFTRAKTPGKFSGGVVKFEQSIPLELKADEHIIVAAAGMNSTMGPVRGPDHSKEIPVAVSNPIYVDVDGGGFKANRDTLGSPLPVMSGRK